MTTQTIEVEGLPEGWKPVRVKISCNISNDSSTMQCAALVVLEKIQPSRISFDEITDGTQDIDADYYIKYKWWREVKETDIPLNSDENKLSLSVDECKELVKYGGFAKDKILEFIKDK